MWIKRLDYDALRERALLLETKYSFVVERLEGFKINMQRYRESNQNLRTRVAELEAALLKANDDAHTARKETLNRPATPVNITALFDDEDSELVEQDRRRAAAEGTTDSLLAMDE